ncbi:GDP-L-fucose synthase [Patescibacteria group bacterium]|nr:GDP-L-fucose synthase [Patescibacteria group bacterium]MCL5409334.1 GDP-L-fucose synthase [Patescibacteria group bacterium]
MINNFWKNKKIVVTGGSGFLGSNIVKLLIKKNPREIVVPRSKTDDLRKLAVCRRVVRNADIIIHAAGLVGGIGFNRQRPGELFYDNLLMGIQLMDEARKANVGKFVAIGTICAYPKFTKIPFYEDDLWGGYPEETNAPYGLAKKMLLVQSQAYRQQYGFNSIYLLPVNLYGPGDNFNSSSSHVIPALIKRFIQAKNDGNSTVVVWGTGRATREFLYVEDAAKGVMIAAEKYNEDAPVNLGSSFEISIKDLAELIKQLVGYRGKITWDKSQPDGQPRRKLDTRRAEEKFGFVAKTQFEEGLKKEIDWYLKNEKNGHK